MRFPCCDWPRETQALISANHTDISAQRSWRPLGRSLPIFQPWLPRVCRELRRELTRGAACCRAERLLPAPPASPTGGAASCPRVYRGGHICATPILPLHLHRMNPKMRRRGRSLPGAPRYASRTRAALSTGIAVWVPRAPRLARMYTSGASHAMLLPCHTAHSAPKSRLALLRKSRHPLLAPIRNLGRLNFRRVRVWFSRTIHPLR